MEAGFVYKWKSPEPTEVPTGGTLQQVSFCRIVLQPCEPLDLSFNIGSLNKDDT